jgi:hypothetical protein
MERIMRRRRMSGSRVDFSYILLMLRSKTRFRFHMREKLTKYLWGMFSQVVENLDLERLLLESFVKIYAENLVTVGITVYKGHTNGTPEMPPTSEMLENQTKACNHLAAAALWEGSQFCSLEAGLWGEYEWYF